MQTDSSITSQLLILRVLSALLGAAILWSLKSIYDKELGEACYTGIIALVLLYLSSMFEDQILKKP